MAPLTKRASLAERMAAILQYIAGPPLTQKKRRPKAPLRCDPSMVQQWLSICWDIAVAISAGSLPAGMRTSSFGLQPMQCSCWWRYRIAR